MKVIQKVTLFLVFSGYTLPAIAMWASLRNLVSRGTQSYSLGKYAVATPNLGQLPDRDPVLQKTAVARVCAEKNNEQNNNRQADDAGESWSGKRQWHWGKALFYSGFMLTVAHFAKQDNTQRDLLFEKIYRNMDYDVKGTGIFQGANESEIAEIIRFCADNIVKLSMHRYGLRFFLELIAEYPGCEQIIYRAAEEHIAELLMTNEKFLRRLANERPDFAQAIAPAVAANIINLSKNRSSQEHLLEFIKINGMIGQILPLLGTSEELKKELLTQSMCLVRLSIDYPNNYVRFLQCFYDSPELFDYFTGETIIKILLNAPQEEYICLIQSLLKYINSSHKMSMSEHERLNLASVIADICVLFKLDIDIQKYSSDQSFADDVLQLIQDLQESYAYRERRDSNQELKKWIEEKLTHERDMIMNDTCGITWNPLANAECQEIEHEVINIFKACNLSNYIKQKLKALVAKEMAEGIDGLNVMASNSCPAGIFDVMGVICLIVGEPELASDSALSWNFILGHEMMHAIDGHLWRGLDALLNMPHNVMSINAYHEKYADVCAALQLGPKACRVAAQRIFNSGDPNMPQRDCHAPGLIRASALLDIARIMEEGTFKHDKKTPLVRWLEARCVHPEYKEFVRLFLQCEDGKCDPGSRVMISPEGNGIGQSHSVQMQEPHHQWMQRIET